jgi:hypothetical protein
MAEHKKGVGIFFGEDLKFDVVLERSAQVNQFAFAVVGRSDAGNEGGIGQARRDASGNVGGRGPLGDIFNAAIRQCDVNLLHVRVHLGGETSSLSAGSRAVKEGPVSKTAGN